MSPCQAGSLEIGKKLNRLVDKYAHVVSLTAEMISEKKRAIS